MMRGSRSVCAVRVDYRSLRTYNEPEGSARAGLFTPDQQCHCDLLSPLCDRMELRGSQQQV